ncbi:lipoprotein N-acyltransferase Lnb domain-containing protein [Pyxidicoccus xibeiensis]|uniref:lipoprotein N-acyltransferase Lnb domain-containing protein n=1 Tax=Pyxidicoccus xibeiensis TaxID=2906759 RepID=UPI0020A6E516|nr:DUF4105 domain-containing protein [Pyxidicoccus xibeiensis]MCP3135960.1 DUF4105 domain-containing protein [Pyxidicoccus xibeiensis]
MARHATLLLVIVLSWSTAVDAAPPEGFGTRPEDLRMKLVTFGPGPDVHHLFGHSALWVEDTRLGASFLYGYGMSSFGRGAAFEFLVKQPTFWAGRVPVQSAFFLYREQDRSISVQELDLTVEQRRRLLARLQHDVRPEHREYRYHPTEANCATRLRDALDEALDGALRSAATGPARLTPREHLRRHAWRAPGVDLMLGLWLNATVDVPVTRWQEVFTPVELARLVADVTLAEGADGRVRLVGRRYDEHLSRAGPVPEVPVSTVRRELLIGTTLAVMAVLLAALRRCRGSRWVRVLFGLCHALVGVTLGTVGLAGFVLRLLSEHPALRPEVGLLLANPLTFALLPLGLAMALGIGGAEQQARRCVAVLCAGTLLALVLQLLPVTGAVSQVPLSLPLAANLGLGVAHGLLLRRAASATVSLHARLQRT